MADSQKPAAEAESKLQHTHPDLLTGEPGSHPIGTALGAVGAAAAGATLGGMAGPLGALAGAVIGGLAGAMAGKEIAENFNPTNPLAEHAYWYSNFRNRSYVGPGDDYETFRQAYQQGWEASDAGRSFDEAEPELREKWEAHELKPSLEWERAREAARDAWERADQQRRGGGQP